MDQLFIDLSGYFPMSKVKRVSEDNRLLNNGAL